MKLTTSYQRELNKFCKILTSGDFNIKQVTSGALTQARAKLNPWAFIRLNDVIVEEFYNESPYKKWKNKRLLAVDGSVLSLPCSKTIVEEFGSENYVEKIGPPKSLGRASLLYDVLNEVTIDAQISGYRTSEKSLFKLHLDKIGKDDIILADRSYGITPILHWIESTGASYCIRLRNDKRKIVLKFVKSKISSQTLEFKVRPKEYENMGMSKDTAPIKVRLVRVVLDSGEIEVLATNMYDEKKYPNSIFKELYFKRWQVEEAYKLLKLRINLESFSGKTARSVRQDFHAKILMMTLCATLAYPIARKVKEEYRAEKTGNKYDQQINKTDALAQTKASLFDIIIKGLRQKVIDVMDSIIESSRSVIRKNRKHHRTKRTSRPKSFNYKPI